MAEVSVKEIHEALSRGVEACIARSEEAYAEKINTLATQIIACGTRVVLLAGPSSSGKTTTANMLADRVRQLGHEATVISLDDFYRSKGDEDYPLNEQGEPDYETPYALRLDLIRGTIREILTGGAVHLPRYDFRLGRRFDRAMTVQIPMGGCAIIEGLHALNPILTDGIPQDAVTKVFVSVSTNVTDGQSRILSGRKIRFIRRLTRDYLYRASDAMRTLSFWSGVLAGEDKYLYPYKASADYKFDTFHLYELGVMKPLAEQVMEEGNVGEEPYLRTIRASLGYFDAIPLELVPQTSLLREFLPGGVYEELY
jgi:uridine kinase